VPAFEAIHFVPVTLLAPVSCGAAGSFCRALDCLLGMQLGQSLQAPAGGPQMATISVPDAGQIVQVCQDRYLVEEVVRAAAR
jgi:hypothetical protein